MKKDFSILLVFNAFSSISIVTGGILGGKLTFLLSKQILHSMTNGESLVFNRFIIGIFFCLIGYGLGLIAVKKNFRLQKNRLSNLNDRTIKTLSCLIIIFSLQWFIIGILMGAGFVGLFVILISII